MPPFANVDLPKLESALAAPQRTMFGEELYPALSDKAAILHYSLVKGHAWSNGNKRMGTVATFLFVGFNGHWWRLDDSELFTHVTWVAASDARCYAEVIAYLRAYFRQRLVEGLPPGYPARAPR